MTSFLGRVFTLLENLPDASRVRSGSPEENVVNTLPATFTPLLASTAVGTLEFRTTLEPVRSRRTKVDFIQGWGDDVDFKNRALSLCVRMGFRCTAM